jgi:hypothetical protein
MMKKGTSQLRERKDFHPTTSDHRRPVFAPIRKNSRSLDQFRLNPTKSGLKIKKIQTPAYSVRSSPRLSSSKNHSETQRNKPRGCLACQPQPFLGPPSSALHVPRTPLTQQREPFILLIQQQI